MTDSLSFLNGTYMDGLTYCGSRFYSINVPSTIPSWLGIDTSTGKLTLTPNDPVLGGTSVTVTVTGKLITYPSITEMVTF